MLGENKVQPAAAVKSTNKVVAADERRRRAIKIKVIETSNLRVWQIVIVALIKIY